MKEHEVSNVKRQEREGRAEEERETYLTHTSPSSDCSCTEGSESSETDRDGLRVVPSELGVVVREFALKRGRRRGRRGRQLRSPWRIDEEERETWY